MIDEMVVSELLNRRRDEPEMWDVKLKSIEEETEAIGEAVRVLLDDTKGGEQNAKLIPQERIRQCIVEAMVDVPVLVPVPQTQAQEGDPSGASLGMHRDMRTAQSSQFM